MGAYGSPDLNNNSGRQHFNHRFVTCKKCGFVYSDYYEQCPQCNTAHRTPKDVGMTLFAIFSIIVSVIAAPLGFILSIISIRNSRNLSKALSIISLIISILCTVFLLIIIVSSDEFKNHTENQNSESATVRQEEEKTLEYTQPDYPEERVYNFNCVNENDGISTTLVSMRTTGKSNGYVPHDGNIFVLCEIEIENNSGKNMIFSKSSCISAYFDDYLTNIGSDEMLEGNISLPAQCTVPDGKKIKGTVGFEVDKNWKKIELRIRPDMLGTHQVIFNWPTNQ